MAVITEIVTGSIKRITFAWTSSAGGSASGTTTAQYTGEVIYAAFVPGTGADQPDNLYDVTLTTSGAVDVLGGTGANLSNASTVYKDDTDGLTSVSASTLTLSVSNAGAANTGQVVVFVVGTWNAYCSLEQIKNRLAPLGMETNITDDAVIDDMIEQASRAIDLFCGGRTFYARTETRYYDRPMDRQLDLDDDLLSVTTLTNGDGDAIAAADYLLYPRNLPPYFSIQLKQSSDEIWEQDDDGNDEQVISVAGTWGMVDRTATDARSARLIRCSEAACIEAVLDANKKRYGVNTTGTAVVTASGVVITPEGLPTSVKDMLAVLVKGNSAG